MEQSAAEAPAPGTNLGGYLLDARIGEGAVGVVFLARQPGSDEPFAVKVLRPGLAADPTLTRRFRREAQAAAGVTHRHLVQVMDAGEADGWHYLVSRFVRGESLADRLNRLTRLDLTFTLRVARHVAAGLDTLHRAGLLHRDVKPSNILLDEAGAAALTDFGLVKSREFSVLTTPGQVLGTVDYLAPELIRGETATSAADVYALGCVIYECLAGTPPFARHSVLTVARAHLDEAPPNLASVRTDLPMQLPVAINAALAKDPRRRPPTALAYASMLDVAARG